MAPEVARRQGARSSPAQRNRAMMQLHRFLFQRSEKVCFSTVLSETLPKLHESGRHGALWRTLSAVRRGALDPG